MRKALLASLLLALLVTSLVANPVSASLFWSGPKFLGLYLGENVGINHDFYHGPTRA